VDEQASANAKRPRRVAVRQRGIEIASLKLALSLPPQTRSVHVRREELVWIGIIGQAQAPHPITHAVFAVERPSIRCQQRVGSVDPTGCDR
jgi:hypothetical protein